MYEHDLTEAGVLQSIMQVISQTYVKIIGQVSEFETHYCLSLFAHRHL